MEYVYYLYPQRLAQKAIFVFLILLGRVALGAQRPIVIKLSRERSVGRSVCLSSALWKNGRSHPAAVWHHRSDGSTDEAVIGVCQSVHGKGYFCGRIWTAPLKPTGTLRRTCETMPQPSKMRFGVVLAVGRGTAVLDGGQRSPTARGRFGCFCSPFSQWEMP